MNKFEISQFAQKLRREPDTHKYNYGHILVIAGSKLMPGAGVLSCNAVLRTGAGLVTYAVTEDFLSAACAMSKPETLFFAYKKPRDILTYIKERKVRVIVIGPGLVEGKKTRKFIYEIISSISLPVVLDASGLSSFAGKTKELRKAKAALIITPHDGEFSKLTGISSSKIKNDGLELAQKFAKEHKLIIVLKRHKTIVADRKQVYINDSGSPAMATAGSGDVLSGMIAALAAIDLDLFDAVRFGVWLHGLAGQEAQKKFGNSLISSDIIESVPAVLKILVQE
jgi:NAD(P)H-hydrate epimerase